MLAESEIEKEKRDTYLKCTAGEIDPDMVWKKRCGLCSRCCEHYRERRVIGRYESSSRSQEVINEQSEICLKHGIVKTYQWMKWGTHRIEERSANEKTWKKVG